MFEATLISIAHDLCRDLRLQKPATLFGSYGEGDTTADDLLRAATKTARFLLSYHTWEHLHGSHSWVVTADVVQPATLVLPPDFHRVVPRTIWDDARRCFLKEASINAWSRHNASFTTLRNAISLTRAGARLSCSKPGSTIRYDYIRKAVCKTTGRVAVAAQPVTPENPCPTPAVEAIAPDILKPDFTADDDIPLWDSELFTLGMIWNLQHRNGNTTNEDYQAFLGRLHEMINHDAPSGVLNMAPSVDSDDDGLPYRHGTWGLQ
jgi:hypothetical protein